MKQIIACMLLLPVMADGQEKTPPPPPPVGIAGYAHVAYSNPKGVLFEAGLSSVYTKRDAVGGLRIGMGYATAKYEPVKGNTLTTVNGLPVIVSNPFEWRASSFIFTAMIDPFPKKNGDVNISFAAGIAGMSTTVKSYDNMGKQVGDDYQSELSFFPKISLGLGVTGMLITAEGYLPLADVHYTDMAPFTIGVLIYPRIIYSKKKPSNK